jgi:hypothetical protein
MAYHDIDGLSLGQVQDPNAQSYTVHLDGSDSAALPDASFVRDALITREGMDLHLQGPHGSVTVEGYFAAEHAPTLVAPDGSALSPALVNSFTHSSSEYAQNGTMNDESPVGEVAEFKGEATVTHADGTTETISSGTPIYQGDVIETAAGGAVNIHFIDDTSFAVSEDARLSIDEYVYDPATQSGENNFSVLKGMFVFTSGLIGRDDPDHVKIETPTGSIGIRGTIIAANANTGEVTVIEGAIVVRDLAGHEVTLAKQFETAKLIAGGGVEHLGQLTAKAVADNFASVSDVSPTLFSSINDSAAEQGTEAPADANAPAPADADAPSDAPANANGSVDQNNDSQVDGTVNAPAVAPVETAPALDIQGGLGTDPMGTQTLGTTAPMGADTGVSATTTSAGLVAPAMGLAPPPPPLGMAPPPPPPGMTAPLNPLPPPPTTNLVQPPPSVINGGGVTVTGNVAPVLVRVGSTVLELAKQNLAPVPEYFKASEGQNWSYNFDREFRDANKISGDVLHYELSTATINYLRTHYNDSVGSNVDTLNSSQGTGYKFADGSFMAGTTNQGWSFDETTGKLDLFLFNAMIANDTIPLEVRAVDSSGAASPFASYAFQAVEASNVTHQGSGTVDNFNLGDSSTDNNQVVFSGDGGDNIYLSASGSTLPVTNSYINTGEGDNVVVIGTNASLNTIVAGGGNDQITLMNANNRLFTMGGDDVVTIDISNAPLITQLTGAPTGEVHLGDSAFNAGAVSAGVDLTDFIANYKASLGGGYGDTLFLDANANASIDFGLINDNYFRGVERIDLGGAGNANTINVALTYNDVIQMTDFKNTLIIRADANDTLNFDTQGHNFTKVANDVTFDDGYGGTATPSNFDIYTDGTVTLMIENNGATINATGLPP